MIKILVISPLFLLMNFSFLTANQKVNTNTRSLNLRGELIHGLRMGLTSAYVAIFDQQEFNSVTLSGDFGYHLQFQLKNSSSVTPLLQMIGLVSIVKELDLSAVSLNVILGLVLNAEWKFGIGAFFYPVSNGLSLTVGYHFIAGGIRYPINLNLVIGENYYSSTALVGFDFNGVESKKKK